MQWIDLFNAMSSVSWCSQQHPLTNLMNIPPPLNCAVTRKGHWLLHSPWISCWLSHRILDTTSYITPSSTNEIQRVDNGSNVVLPPEFQSSSGTSPQSPSVKARIRNSATQFKRSSSHRTTQSKASSSWWMGISINVANVCVVSYQFAAPVSIWAATPLLPVSCLSL